MAQRSSSEIRIVDYLEDSHRTYDSYVTELRAKPYRWGKDFLPHDGKAKNAQTGMSPIEVLRKLGRDVVEVPEIGVEEGIKAARQVFGRVFFDEAKTARLVHCLKRYRRTINQTTNEPGAPAHDEFSHGADAFRYLSVIADQMSNEDMVITDPYAAFRRGWAA
jgi:phage terminase large subunit